MMQLLFLNPFFLDW